jgi:D-alanyl-D-alanine carboxypeptidase
MNTHRWLLLINLLVCQLAWAQDSTEDTAEFLADQFDPYLSPSKAVNPSYAHVFKLLRPDGTTKLLASKNPNLLLKPASTMKLFTGWWAYQEKTRTDAYLGLMLKDSVNSMAQSTLLALGGTTAMEDYYRNLGLAVTAQTFKPADGSGLSYANQTNCVVQIELLEKIRRDNDYLTFRNLLAQPRKNGTLKKRLRNLAGKVFAKTGTLKKTAALSGFIEAPQGTIVFCVISDYLNKTLARERLRIDAMVLQNYNLAR